MKESVYLETSVVSYCVGRINRDLVVAARQQITKEWWDSKSNLFDLFVSELVVEEASKGDQFLAKQRLELIKDIDFLDVNHESENLAMYLIEQKAIPKECPEDAMHIAVATLGGVDFILTWNFKHINNASTRLIIERNINRKGYECPVICTPEELIGN